MSRRVFACLLLSFAAAACTPAPDESDRPETARDFPRAVRPVSQITSNSFSTEEARDDRREAEQVMALAGVAPGMSVADIGAGDGYYTVRLAAVVGETGRVLANDIDEDALRRLGDRVERERLDNISIIPGEAADPRLPPASFDRIFMVHMYHEVTEPYAFLWHLRPALRQGGKWWWWILTGLPISTASPRNCCFANSNGWAIGSWNLSASPKFPATMRNSKLRANGPSRKTSSPA